MCNNFCMYALHTCTSEPNYMCTVYLAWCGCNVLYNITWYSTPGKVISRFSVQCECCHTLQQYNTSVIYHTLYVHSLEVYHTLYAYNLEMCCTHRTPLPECTRQVHLNSNYLPLRMFGLYSLYLIAYLFTFA